MKEAIMRLSEALKTRVYRAACTKGAMKEETKDVKQKRKFEEQEWRRRMK